MSTIRISHIVPLSLVDGPGARTALYTQGCSIGRSNPCKGCQSPHLFSEQGGGLREVGELAQELLSTGLPITLIGGEPLDQAEGLYYLIMRLHEAGRHIIIYSGYTWAELLGRATDIHSAEGHFVAGCLVLADILVDGRFRQDLDDAFMQWRGSSNQRPILLQETWATGELVVDDWESQVITISEDGSMLGTIGMIDLLMEEGEQAKLSRRCGQTR